jgi:hypothetical protein
LFTIIACTLTIQHLNVPEQREGRDPGWRGDLKWSAKDTLRSLKWMAITILAPETLIGIGWNDLVSARRLYRRLRDQAAMDGVPWTMTHAHFARMGGFVVRSNQGTIQSEPVAVVENKTVVDETSIERGLARNTTTSDCSIATEAGSVGTEAFWPRAPIRGTPEAQIPGNSIPSLGPHPNPYHLTVADILNLQKHSQLPKLPSFTQEEINDKSKSNVFVKTIAITQILWTVISILIRTGRKLAVTQLEITVLAFASCSIIIYGLNWQKPKDVKTTSTLLSFPGDLPAETLRVLRISCGGRNTYRNDSMLASLLGIDRSAIVAGSSVPNDYTVYYSKNSSEGSNNYFLIGLMLGCMIFGGIHVAAWNFDFLTKTDLILWRVASVWCTAFTLLTALEILGYIFLNIGDALFVHALAVLVGLYIVGRLILLVEVFRTLLFLPPDAFVATSASNIPHVA